HFGEWHSSCTAIVANDSRRVETWNWTWFGKTAIAWKYPAGMQKKTSLSRRPCSNGVRRTRKPSTSGPLFALVALFLFACSSPSHLAPRFLSPTKLWPALKQTPMAQRAYLWNGCTRVQAIAKRLLRDGWPSKSPED